MVLANLRIGSILERSARVIQVPLAFMRRVKIARVLDERERVRVRVLAFQYHASDPRRR